MQGQQLPQKTLGQFLRMKRQERGLSLRKLAEMISSCSQQEDCAITDGISAAFLSEVENSRRTPSDKLINKIARVLEIDERELQKYDSRVPTQIISDLSQRNPQYGTVFRRIALAIQEEGLTPHEILERLTTSHIHK